MPPKKQGGGPFNDRRESLFDERRDSLFEKRSSLFNGRQRPLYGVPDASRLQSTSQNRSNSSMRKEFDFCNNIARTASNEFFLVELNETFKTKYFVGAVVVTFGTNPLTNMQLKFNAVRVFFYRDTTPFSEWKIMAVQVADTSVGKNWSWLSQDGTWTDIVSTKEWREIVGGRNNKDERWYPSVFLSYASYRNPSNTNLYSQYGKMDKFHAILLVLSVLHGSLFFAKEAKTHHFSDTQHDLNRNIQDVVDALVMADGVSKSFKATISREITDVAYNAVVTPPQQQARQREPQAMEQVYNDASGIHFKVPKNYLEKKRRNTRSDQERQYPVAPKFSRLSSLFAR